MKVLLPILEGIPKVPKGQAEPHNRRALAFESATRCAQRFLTKASVSATGKSVPRHYRDEEKPPPLTIYVVKRSPSKVTRSTTQARKPLVRALRVSAPCRYRNAGMWKNALAESAPVFTRAPRGKARKPMQTCFVRLEKDNYVGLFSSRLSGCLMRKSRDDPNSGPFARLYVAYALEAARG